jgi:hypothetical protein
MWSRWPNLELSLIVARFGLKTFSVSFVFIGTIHASNLYTQIHILFRYVARFQKCVSGVDGQIRNCRQLSLDFKSVCAVDGQV